MPKTSPESSVTVSAFEAALSSLHATISGIFTSLSSLSVRVQALEQAEPQPLPEFVTPEAFAALTATVQALDVRVKALEAVPVPTPTPVPEPTPTPTPTPEPTPQPTPTPTPTPVPSPTPQPGNHGYFDMLVSRPDFYKGYSLRPNPQDLDITSPHWAGQLGPDNKGGLHASDCDPALSDLAFRYDPAMDAAKAAIPPFARTGICDGQTLVQPVAASTPGALEVLVLSDVTSTFGPPKQRQMQIDGELFELRMLTVEEGGDGTRAYDEATNRLAVIRGQYDTQATPHAAGAPVRLSVNAMVNYLALPLGTEDGHSYLMSWECRWDDSCLGIGTWDTGQKTFQITGGAGTKLFEPKLNYAAKDVVGFDPAKHIGIVSARAYNSLNTLQEADWTKTNGNTMGPRMTAHTDLAPRDGTFMLKPNVWTRWWILVEQRARDFDLFSMWVADENTAPVLVYGDVPLSVSQGKVPTDTQDPQLYQTMREFWFALGNSTSAFKRGGLFDLVSWYRNFAVLKDPADVEALLRLGGGVGGS